MEKRKNSANFNDVVELLNIIQKNVKLEEKGSNYEATYSGVDDSAKEAFSSTFTFFCIIFKSSTTSLKLAEFLRFYNVFLIFSSFFRNVYFFRKTSRNSFIVSPVVSRMTSACLLS